MKADIAERIRESCRGRPDITATVVSRGGQPGYEVYQLDLAILGQARQEHYVMEKVARARLKELSITLLSRDKWDEIKRKQ